MYQTQTTTSRRRFLHGGLLGTLALVASLGALPIPDVAAGKKTKKKANTVQSRNQAQKDSCENIGGGTLEVNNMGGGRWETKCHGGDNDGYSCTNTATSTVCVYARTIPDLPTQPLQPESPFADPSQGGAQPLQPDSPFANPGDAPVLPLEPDGSGVTITAYDGDKHHKAKHHGKRKHHRRSKRSR